MRRITSLMLALILLFALAVPGLAAETKTVTITYRGISIVIDGDELIPDNGAGVSVEPFIMGGYTYLPLRAVAGALGLGVGWDNATSTITLTSGGEAKNGAGAPLLTSSSKDVPITYRDIKIVLNGKSVTPLDADGNAIDPFVMDGTTYLPLRAMADLLGIAVNWDGDTSTVFLGEQHGSCWRQTAIELRYSSGGAADVRQSFEYDEKGNIVIVTTVYPDGSSPKETLTYTYNDKGQPVREVSSRGDVTVLTYDALGNLVYVNCGDGTWAAYTYDAQGNVITAKYSDAGEVTTVTGTYSADGRLLREVMSSSNGTITTDYVYDASGALVQNHFYMDGDLYYSDHFTNDALGRVISQYTSYPDGTKSGTITVSYTDLPNGGLQSVTTSCYDDGSLMCTTTDREEYDANGNLSLISSNSDYGDGDIVFYSETYYYEEIKF